MTNLETTDQFRAANRRWREKNKDSGPTTPVTTKWQGVPSVIRVDRDGDTIMAPARIGGGNTKGQGDRKKSSGKRRAKWVDAAERERRRERQLCFRCGASGHRIKECPYGPPLQLTAINAVTALPLLEDVKVDSDPADYKSEKE